MTRLEKGIYASTQNGASQGEFLVSTQFGAYWAGSVLRRVVLPYHTPHVKTRPRRLEQVVC